MANMDVKNQTLKYYSTSLLLLCYSQCPYSNTTTVFQLTAYHLFNIF